MLGGATEAPSVPFNWKHQCQVYYFRFSELHVHQKGKKTHFLLFPPLLLPWETKPSEGREGWHCFEKIALQKGSKQRGGLRTHYIHRGSFRSTATLVPYCRAVESGLGESAFSFRVLNNDLGCGDLSHSAHHWRPQDYTKTSSAPHFAIRRLESYCPGRRLLAVPWVLCGWSTCRR